MCYDMDGCLYLGPSKITATCIWKTTGLALVVLIFALLHRADESQPARNSCPRLPHSVDSRFGHYHVAVEFSFYAVRSALQEFESHVSQALISACEYLLAK